VFLKRQSKGCTRGVPLCRLGADIRIGAKAFTFLLSFRLVDKKNLSGFLIANIENYLIKIASS